MSNTMIHNPVAQVAAAMNRPVTKEDIAKVLNLPIGTVRAYLSKNPTASDKPGSKVALVRETAKNMGYDPAAAHAYGTTYKDGRTTGTWYKGNFKSRQEEIARMQELRAQGYSNAEIAKAIGRTAVCVWTNIGPQDPELSNQNRAMAQHIRAQKNAARKAYVINKPIREYNKRVEQHNKMKAELALLQVDLLTQKPIIEQAAQTKIDFPLIDLHTVQPTALQ